MPTQTNEGYEVYAYQEDRFYVARKVTDNGYKRTQWLTKEGKWTELSILLHYFPTASAARRAAKKASKE